MGEQEDAIKCGGVAQLGEHLPCKQGVKSSNLSISTREQSLRNIRTLKTAYIKIKIFKYFNQTSEACLREADM